QHDPRSRAPWQEDGRAVRQRDHEHPQSARRARAAGGEPHPRARRDPRLEEWPRGRARRREEEERRQVRPELSELRLSELPPPTAAHDAPGTAELLVPWRVERILHDDADFLVVDKPSGVVVHGGDEELADDLVHRLEAWLRSQGRDTYLGVHQRLDQATSGLLFFTRRKDVNAAGAAAMEGRQVRRTYLAVVTLGGEGAAPRGGRGREPTRRPELRSRGRLEHQLHHVRGRTELVTGTGRGQRAVTEYEVLETVGRRALVRLHPHTGRTHQLRVQLAAAGAPICGDR